MVRIVGLWANYSDVRFPYMATDYLDAGLQMIGPRILTLDIETAPYEGYFWDIWEQNIGLDMITQEWTILSYAAKWLDRPQMIYEDVNGRGKGKIRDDRKLLKSLHSLLDEADIVVAQNGKKFDARKINARMLMENFKPYSPIKIIDTYLECRSLAAVTSTRLAWLSKYLADVEKSDHRRFPGFELHAECLKYNQAAWREIKKYNKTDVISTEQVYLRLRPWIKSHPNVGTYAESVGAVCPKCGSGELQKRGVAVLSQGRYARLQCMSCGGWSRTKEQLIDRDQRKRLLVNVL